MAHKYRIGQSLELSAAPWHSKRPQGPCRVLACMPHEHGQPMYRVQCINERNERVVEEIDLSPSRAAVHATAAKNEALMSIAIDHKR